MIISKGKRHALRILFISTLLLMAKPMYDNGHTSQKEAIGIYNFSGRTFVCGIDLGDDMKGGHGLETGLAYEMMKSFASAHNCRIAIKVGGKNVNYVDSLQQGKIDLLIIHHEDVDGIEGILMSQNITDCCAMAVREDRSKHLQEVDKWVESYTQSEEFIRLREIFGRQNNPVKLAERGVRRNRLCPYDELLKEYASQLGWDWRMLAAVVYQESKFSINSRSHRGATGLMQVMPRTAEYYNVTDLNDPEQNLIAGTSHLKRLQNLYRDNGMTQQERIHFTLAAYNAGEGRIMDCRNLAKANRLDHNTWEEVIKVIPQMSEDSILVDENVKLGKFKGKETMAYVENIMNLYSAICQVCPEN